MSVNELQALTRPGATSVLVTESVPAETLEQLAAQGYHFRVLPAPFTSEESRAVFGD